MTTTAPASALRRRSPAATASALAAWILILAVLCVASLAFGSAQIPLPELWRAALGSSDAISQATLLGLRVPRTALGVLVGAALGVAGALMQAYTRNPLADPGVLGVNAGAGLAITLAVAFLGVTRIQEYLPFAFIGALVAVILVYLLAAARERPPSPLRMTLVGVAASAVMVGLSQTLALIDVQAFDRMRFWGAGTIADRPSGVLEAVAPWIAIGLVLALMSGRALNAIALGEDLARSVGARVGLTRAGVAVSATLLCGAATAAAGPLAFVGLIVPHIVRPFTGPDQRRIIAFSAVVAPSLLLICDILGRFMAPGELQVGVVTALIGAPILALLARNPRAAHL